MRVGYLTAGLLLTSAIAAGAATITMSPPPAKIQPQVQSQPKVLTNVQPKAQAKLTCPCDCPDSKNNRQHAKARPGSRAVAQRGVRRYAAAGRYDYRAAAPVDRAWRGRAHDGPPSYTDEGLQVEDRGWTGGVGMSPDSGGGAGFMDGYGQIHFANGGGVENGPTYNSYDQSFQYNPSQAGPFQPRLMGGFAPPSSGSR